MKIIYFCKIYVFLYICETKPWSLYQHKMKLMTKRSSIRIFLSFLLPFIVFCQETQAKQSVSVKINYYKELIKSPDLIYEERLSTYDSIIHLSKLANLLSQNTAYQLEKADFLSKNGRYFEANHIAKNVLQQIDSAKNQKEFKELQKKALLQMILSNYLLGMVDAAMQYITEFINLNNKENLNYEARIYSILGSCFDTYNMPAAAKEKYAEALKIIEENPQLEEYTYYVVYSNYAGLFYKAQKFDSAFHYLGLAENYCKGIPEQNSLKISTLQNKAILYQALNENKIAEECFLRALAIPKNNSNILSRTLCQQNLAYLYFEEKQYDKALLNFEEALQSAKEIHSEELGGKIKTEMAEVYYGKGEYKKAFDLYFEGKNQLDKVFYSQNAQKILEYKSRHETENLKKTIEINDLKNKNKNIVLSVLSVLLLISLSIIIISIRKLLGRNKENHQLNASLDKQVKEKREEIEQTQHTFSETIQMKNMELTSNAIVLAKLKDCMDSIQEDVNRLIKENDMEERKNIAKEIKKVLDFNKIEKNWDEFRLYFEQTHPSFFKKLSASYPDLTLNEQRLCALLALNMRIKEIAEITNRSSRSIETFVYRIRKKLKIPAEIKTNSYFKDFLGDV